MANKRRFRHVVYIEFKDDLGKCHGVVVLDPSSWDGHGSFQERIDAIIERETHMMSVNLQRPVYAVPCSAFVSTESWRIKEDTREHTHNL
jgi:hypothetical protein